VAVDTKAPLKPNFFSGRLRRVPSVKLESIAPPEPLLSLFDDLIDGRRCPFATVDCDGAATLVPTRRRTHTFTFQHHTGREDPGLGLWSPTRRRVLHHDMSTLQFARGLRR